jgi:hypothetical protein
MLDSTDYAALPRNLQLFISMKPHPDEALPAVQHAELFQ